jgi:hypothetical protein
MKRNVYISVFYQQGIESTVLRDICAGFEEEGVPFSCTEESEKTNAIELGKRAASLSALEVGIGVGIDHTYVICHEKLGGSEPYLISYEANGRMIGQNAARLVKGLPLLQMKKG